LFFVCHVGKKERIEKKDMSILVEMSLFNMTSNEKTFFVKAFIFCFQKAPTQENIMAS
jgi:hypothetical protein